MSTRRAGQRHSRARRARDRPDEGTQQSVSRDATARARGLACAFAAIIREDRVSPIISDSNASIARKQLLSYQMPLDAAKQPPKYYLDKCNKDPSASSFSCNLKTESNITTCGSAMPKLGYNNVQGTPATGADVQRFAAWIACGAPDN
jgi:hypothetical protein